MNFYELFSSFFSFQSVHVPTTEWNGSLARAPISEAGTGVSTTDHSATAFLTAPAEKTRIRINAYFTKL